MEKNMSTIKRHTNRVQLDGGRRGRNKYGEGVINKKKRRRNNDGHEKVEREAELEGICD